MKVIDLFQKLFWNFNSRQMKDATLAFKKHLDEGGKMLVAMGGAMSSAQLGITLAPMIRENKVHIISCTGVNLEESVFRLVAHRRGSITRKASSSGMEVSVTRRSPLSKILWSSSLVKYR